MHQIDPGVGRGPEEVLGRGQGEVGRLQLGPGRREGSDLLVLVEVGLRAGVDPAQGPLAAGMAVPAAEPTETPEA